MITLTSQTIWLRWEQAGSGESGFAGRGETSVAGSTGSGFDGRDEIGFVGSKLVALDLVSLVGVKLTSLRASWLLWIWLHR